MTSLPLAPRAPTRVVMLGTGTGIGKTWTSLALARALIRRGQLTVALKPIESGVPGEFSSGDSDGEQLARASSFLPAPPPYRLPEPISPHLAARRAGIQLELDRASDYVRRCELGAAFAVVESAGGVFSPLGPGITNFELARALDPGIWVLCAPDALGVLHQLTATLEAMRGRGREPDFVVLSEPSHPDPSTGSNAAELVALGIARPVSVLRRGCEADVEPLAALLLERASN